MAQLTLRGARANSLQSLDLDIPLGALVVVTGPSGSGKSSLAFDTIFAEGQRRLVELLSPTSRRLAERLPRPDFDVLEGLPPSLACEQTAPKWGPYASVATAIDIAHALALLFTRCGQLHCPACGRAQGSHSVQEMVDELMSLPARARFVLSVPLEERGEALALRCRDLLRDGFTRLQVDGEVLDLAEVQGSVVADSVALQVDRLVRKQGIESRLADSLELALRVGGGRVAVDVLGAEPIAFTAGAACHGCGADLPALTPALLSFRSAEGRCDACGGRGQRAAVDVSRLVADGGLSLAAGAITPWREKNAAYYAGLLRGLCERAGIDADAPWSELSEAARHLVLHGDGKGDYRGVVFDIERRLAKCTGAPPDGGDGMDWIQRYLSMQPCESCEGSRLSAGARSVRLGGSSMVEVAETRLADLPQTLRSLEDAAVFHPDLARRLVGEIEQRLQVAESLGLSYLPTGRSTLQLSSGEAQRLRLVELLSTSLRGVLFVLDEPTAGLHAQDSKKVLALLRRGLEDGNSLLLVEHDRDMIAAADCVIDMGPGAGRAGGRVVAQGPASALPEVGESSTGAYLSGRSRVALAHEARGAGDEVMVLRGASANNLQSIDVRIPVGRLTCVVGVSGAGKSSLLMRSLLPALKGEPTSTYERLDCERRIERCLEVATSGIARSPRSTPATYTGLADVIRDLYAKLPESRARGFKKSRFSTNVAGGRCIACKGDGYLRVDHELFADQFVPCTTCSGRRFDRQTLQVRYRGLDIAALFDMSVDEASAELSAIPKAQTRLVALQRVGLGYVRLGQPSTSLSGGELSRLVLARELAKPTAGHCVYLIDEPSLGLHWCDLQVLLEALDELVVLGHTVVLCDHHVDLMRSCDHLIELGPGPGEQGGRVIATGSPRDLAALETPTGLALRSI